MTTGKFQSTKRIEGFSTCFRQWKADHTHCKFLHGYSIYFDVTFEGELDKYNWVMDFGFMKRYESKEPYTGIEVLSPNYTQWLSPNAWFNYFFDHTVILADNDPELSSFLVLDDKKVIRLRVLPKVGCEMFAKFVFENLNDFVKKHTEGRVKIKKVQCFEHAKNSAIYKSKD